ncbi:D-alanine--D-alanine ligase family protein [Aeromicrobium sp. CTD01-1L150]|uniref:D-alanine--D-alanine ligase family protein n=1 Tax=Aeromicrobium sp. CTD01-1L150 TaxID=3341830 RepID=UPI0035C0B9D3
MNPSTSRTAGRPRLAVIFGGRSSEHQVSCLTARNVVGAIDHDAYEVVTVGITHDGRWVRDPMAWDDLPDGQLPSVDPTAPHFSWDELRDVDVAFPLLHGPWGEDGTVQGLLEMASVRYVGAGVLASSAGMDKPFTKSLFSAGGLPQVPHVTILPAQWEHERDRAFARVRALGLPVFVKPARAGSSSGVTMVEDLERLDAAVEAARELDPKVIVEAAARGKRELEVGVIQQPDGTPLASVVGEVVQQADSGHEFYDFEAKYLDGTSANVVPADISTTVAEQVRTYAVQAFTALGVEGLARVDFFATDDGLVINEINTMPGFTSTSMFPVLWEASGISYAELVDRLVQLALARDVGLR